MRRTRLSLALAFAVGLLASAAQAQLQLQPDQPLSQQIEILKTQGWREVQDGLLQRSRAGFLTESLAFGYEGHKWALGQALERLNLAIDRYTKSPTPELAREVAALTEALSTLERAQVDASAEELRNSTSGCSFSFSATADAYATTWQQGVGGQGNASYWTNCSAYSGSVWASAFGQTATANGSFGQGFHGTSVSTAASTTVPGGPHCYSEAYGSVSVPSLGLFYSATDTNYSCPPPPPSVSISGDAHVSVSGYDCVTATWYASASGGTPGYTYSWTIDGAYAGSGSSLSRTYCGGNYDYTDIESIGVVVTDAAGQPASNGFTAYIYFQRFIDPWDYCFYDGWQYVCY